MDIKKLAPWNWFKKEEENAGETIPVRYDKTRDQGYGLDHPLAHLHQGIDRMFDNIFRRFGIPSLEFEKSFFPRIADGMLKPDLDISVTDKEYAITVEIPGVDEKDIKLELTDDTLIIKGEKKQEKEENEKNYYRVERSYGSFQRVLSLPEDADQDDIRASFKSGILRITVPRKGQPTSDVKRIEIQST